MYEIELRWVFKIFMFEQVGKYLLLFFFRKWNNAYAQDIKN